MALGGHVSFQDQKTRSNFYHKLHGTVVGWEIGCANFSDLFLPKLVIHSQPNFSGPGLLRTCRVKIERISFFVDEENIKTTAGLDILCGHTKI